MFILEVNRKLQKKTNSRLPPYRNLTTHPTFTLVPSFLSIYHRHTVCHHPKVIDINHQTPQWYRRICDPLRMSKHLDPCQSLGFSLISIVLESWTRRQLIPWSSGRLGQVRSTTRQGKVGGTGEFKRIQIAGRICCTIKGS